MIKEKSKLASGIHKFVHNLNSYPNTAPLYEGEQHILGYNFCGPKTAYEERVARGDKPVNELDKCCFAHDTVYNKDNSTIKEIKDSDDDLRKCLDKAKKKGLSELGSHLVMSEIFKGKRTLENLGILHPKHFAKK